ncbi:unnamed protein product [Mucor hiemalis]
MVYANAICDRVSVTHNVPKMKVSSGQSVSLEAKGVDTSMKITFMVSNGNYPMMVYLLRFFRKGTSHRVSGTINVSAFCFDDSTRAFASVRLGVAEISPIREVDHAGAILGEAFAAGCIPFNENNVPTSAHRVYKKCKFIVFKYIWDNWENDELVDGKKDALREALSETLEDLYEELVEARIIPGQLNPVSHIATENNRRFRRNVGRVSRRMVIKAPNPAVKPSDMVSPDLLLSELLDDNEPFKVALFVLTNSGTSAGVDDIPMN